MKSLSEIKIQVAKLEKKYKTVNGIFEEDIKDYAKSYIQASSICGPKIDKIIIASSNGKITVFWMFFMLILILLVSAALIYFNVVDFSVLRPVTSNFTQQLSIFQTTILPLLLTFFSLLLLILSAIYPVLQINAKILDTTLNIADQSIQKLQDKKFAIHTISEQQSKLNIECLNLLKEITAFRKISNNDEIMEIDAMYSHVKNLSQLYNFHCILIISKLSK